MQPWQCSPGEILRPSKADANKLAAGNWRPGSKEKDPVCLSRYFSGYKLLFFSKDRNIEYKANRMGAGLPLLISCICAFRAFRWK